MFLKDELLRMDGLEPLRRERERSGRGHLVSRSVGDGGRGGQGCKAYACTEMLL